MISDRPIPVQTALQVGGAFSPVPDLPWYDHLLFNSSGGKDSQCGLRRTVEVAGAAGVLDRLTVVHADLGDEEWPQTPQIAAAQAAHYGLRFEVVRRIRPETGRPDSLLDYVRRRRRWPSAAARYCTSDFKRGPVRTLMTRLVRETDPERLGRRVRILDIMGFRAEESPDRRKRAVFRHDASASNKTRRHVDEWLPIQHLLLWQVWDCIAEAGTPIHPAYGLGMKRASCRFCVLASKSDLICSIRANPELADEYASVEAEIGHTFQHGQSIANLIAEARSVP